jgi:hypothetical protein
MEKENKIIIGLMIIVVICVSAILILLPKNSEESDEYFIDCGNGFFVEYCEPLNEWVVHDGTYIYMSFSDKDSAIYYAKHLT